MERESFEDETTAVYMNEHFICIKVDREEHPDVDHLYMDAVQAISGSGGWPLNVFVTPERIPFFGGTYYPPRPAYNRPSWTQLMQRMNEIWTTQHGEVVAQSAQMMDYLKQASGVATKDTSKVTAEDCQTMADTLLKMADKEWGGFGQAPKFPGTMAISFLLEHYHYTGNKEALTHAILSLDKMIAGGIYDQLGGGFARYSTDKQWLAPHFEKMLYDNALLILALCDGYHFTGNERYKEVIEATIDFVNRELKDESGGFYSALDADSEGVEGKFYTWTWDEWQTDIGGVGDPIAEAYFGIVKDGNWEGTNILHEALPIEGVAEKFKVDAAEARHHIATVKQKLLDVRKGRIRPQTDDKSLLSWNALMNMALTKAGVTLEREDYLAQALSHMKWMDASFSTSDGALLHTWKGGIARIIAKLDDYAYLIQAMIQLGIATGKHEWILKAADYCETAIRLFVNSETPFFYFSSSEQTDIPVRKTDVYDGATPSANSVMAHNLQALNMLMERSEWGSRAEEMIDNMTNTSARYTYSFGYWAILLQRALAGPKTIVMSGISSQQNHYELRRKAIPHAMVLNVEDSVQKIPLTKGKESDSESLIFVCTGAACLQPVATIDDALLLL
jgi:uncharacterized protein YyaL (SSP411 family)